MIATTTELNGMLAVRRRDLGVTLSSKLDGYGRGFFAIDTEMMTRCIQLSEIAVQRGELPFAALICKGNDVIVETTNLVARNADVTCHAELVAVSQAQKILGHKDFADCTLYTTVEPCAMCSFAIRETRIGRVVFSIKSPVMGGLSKWNVLRDPELSRALPEIFGPAPEVIPGLLCREAEKVWRTWNPLFWSVIKLRGIFGGLSRNWLRGPTSQVERWLWRVERLRKKLRDLSINDR